MRKNRIFSAFPLITAALSMVGFSSAAGAQEVTAAPTKGTAFDRNRTIPILERIPQGFEKKPLKIGTFLVAPSIETDLTLNDNAYAKTTNKRTNVAGVITPSVNVISDWSRNQLGLTADANVVHSFTLPSEDYNAYEARIAGRYDIAQSVFLYAYASRRRQAELRTDPGAITNTVVPVMRNVTDTDVRLTRSVDRLRLTAEAMVSDLNYDDFRFASGVQPALGLNRTALAVTGRADYAITPDVALVFVVRRTHQNFHGVSTLPDLNRSGNKIEIQAGASFELPEVLRGEATVGYLGENYESPAFRDIKGIGGRASVEYFLSRLTSLRLDASRTVEESGNPQFPQFLRSLVRFSADHELFRDVVVSASASYLDDRYYQPRRTQPRPEASLSARWLINPRMTLRANYDYLRQTTQPISAGNNFSVNSFVLGLVLNL